MWPDPPVNFTGVRTSRHSVLPPAGSAAPAGAATDSPRATTARPVATRRTSDRVRFFAECVMKLSPFPQWIAQFSPQNLSDRGFRNRIHQHDFFRHLVTGQPATYEFPQFVGVHGGVGTDDDEGRHRFDP